MAKRILLLLTALTAAVLIAGCGAVIGNEYVYVTAHVPTVTEAPKGSTAEASTYAELREAIAALVEAHEENGTVRLIGYRQDAESDVVSACMDVSNTPLGAYAVYYINSKVSRIVSYYEADISITYRRTAEQVNAIVDVENDEQLQAAVLSALRSYEGTLTVRTGRSGASERSIISCVEEQYYANPDVSVEYPEVSVTAYPQSGASQIYEVVFSYKYIKSSLAAMRDRLQEQAEELAEAVKGFEDEDALLRLVTNLSKTVEMEEDSWSDENDDGIGDTAYGALIRGSATREGFAMALKLLCDRSDIDCKVVRGRVGGHDSGWNIVRLGDDWYHVDAGRCASEGMSAGFLKDDDAMSGEYLWDREKYPECTVKYKYADAAGRRGGAQGRGR